MSRATPSAYSGSVEPGVKAVAVTPSNSVDLPDGPCRSLYIGVGGNVSIDLMNGGDAIVFKGAAAGSILPLRVTRVRVTGTTATDIVAIY